MSDLDIAGLREWALLAGITTRSSLAFEEGRRRSRQWRERSPPNKRQIDRVIDRDGLRCYWCQRLCDPTLKATADLSPTRDHLLRRADGGSNRLDNIVLACRRCNSERHKPGWKAPSAQMRP